MTPDSNSLAAPCPRGPIPTTRARLAGMGLLLLLLLTACGMKGPLRHPPAPAADPALAAPPVVAPAATPQAVPSPAARP